MLGAIVGTARSIDLRDQCICIIAARTMGLGGLAPASQHTTSLTIVTKFQHNNSYHSSSSPVLLLRHYMFDNLMVAME